MASQEEEDARAELLHCTVRIWRGDDESEPVECYGTPTDVAAAVLKAFDVDDGEELVEGMVISIIRGLPEDMVLGEPSHDPRRDT